MSANPAPIPQTRGTTLDISSLPSDASTSSLWDRVSAWVSDNKAVSYSIAGVAVIVTGAGVVYYLNTSRGEAKAEEKRRASKKERRKAKKEKEKEEIEKDATPTTVEESGMSFELLILSLD